MDYEKSPESQWNRRVQLLKQVSYLFSFSTKLQVEYFS